MRLYLVAANSIQATSDFDGLLASILRKDAKAIVAFPEAQLGEWTEVGAALEPHINRRYTDRVRVFRRLDFDEFIRLAQLCDVV